MLAYRNTRSGSVIPNLRDARVVLSTWGAVPYDSDVLRVCPELALVTYGAEFTFGLIFTALKNVFARHHATRRGLENRIDLAAQVCDAAKAACRW
ncbi:MAG: hypothetical protein EA403_15475 [Spirochaetaceae bacterium]|nr:MAG: hypothetical protein EA403_15475 [Spirochaetaceae bacterium]